MWAPPQVWLTATLATNTRNKHNGAVEERKLGKLTQWTQKSTQQSQLAQAKRKNRIGRCIFLRGVYVCCVGWKSDFYDLSAMISSGGALQSLLLIAGADRMRRRATIDGDWLRRGSRRQWLADRDAAAGAAARLRLSLINASLTHHDIANHSL